MLRAVEQKRGGARARKGLSGDADFGHDGGLPSFSMAAIPYRLEAHFSGRVQGVGFRYTARQIAQGYEVTGQVRNLPDGRVHLLVEGTPEEVRNFVAEIQSHLVHHIKETAVRELSGPAEFRDFHIG
jgi:acylphosphatase